jgi:membrane-associated phospholipid phosphatase
MTLVYLLAVLTVLAPAVLAPLAMRRLALSARSGRFAARIRAAADASVAAIGTAPTAAVALLAGSGAVVAVCWPLGEALSLLEPTVDRPVFDWVAGHRDDTWQQLNGVLTGMGERPVLKIVSVAAALLFAALWRRRRWLPIVAMTGQFVLEQYTQEILKRVVDRGHPPTNLGTFPSGGCARVLLTLGTIGMLAMLTWRTSAAVRSAGLTLLAVAVGVEGYTRVYVQKHWLTDVVGGWVFGALLLGVVAFTLYVAAGRHGPAGGTTEPHPRFAEAGVAVR